MISDKLMQKKADSRKIHPCHTNRASALGDMCERRLVLMRTNWQDQELYSVDLQARFDMGNMIEAQLRRDITDLGIDVIEAQRGYHDKPSNVSGHIDGIAVIDGSRIPIEIKSMANAIYDQIHSLDDFKKYPWTRKYLVQLQLYLFFCEADEGLFILCSLDGRIKEISMRLDLDLVDSHLKKADRINQHVKDNTLPDYIVDASECQRCQFFGTCQPPQDYGAGMLIIDDEEFLECLTTRHTTQESQRAYNRAHKRVKDILGKRMNVLAGDFRITQKESINGKLTMKIEYLEPQVPKNCEEVKAPSKAPREHDDDFF